MSYLIYTAITGGLFFVAWLLLKNYLPSYFNEKAKLLAQKEDIAAITEKIESVKIAFAKDTEILKAGLLRLTNIEVSHRNEERSSVIEFYGTYNQFLYSLLEINYGSYNRNNVKELSDKRTYIESFYAKTGIAQAKLKLLIKNDEIVTLSHKLWISILKFKGWMDMQLLTLQQNIENQIHLTDEFLPLLKKLDENKERLQKMSTEQQDLAKAKEELVNKFYADKLDQYSQVMPFDTEFANKVKGYLTK